MPAVRAIGLRLLTGACGAWAAAGIPGPAALAAGIQFPARAGTLEAIGCSHRACVVAGTASSSERGVVIALHQGRARGAQVVQGTSVLWGAACATPRYCIAVGEQDYIRAPVWNGSSGEGSGSEVGVLVVVRNGRAGRAIRLPSMITIHGVVCPSASLCLAVGQYETPGGILAGSSTGAVVPIARGHPGPAQAISGTAFLSAIACRSTSSCVAVAQGPSTSSGIVALDGGHAGRFVPLPDSHAWGSTSGIQSVGCIHRGPCLGTATQASIAIAGGRPGRWRAVPRSSEDLGPLSCPSSSACVTIDGYGGGQDAYVLSRAGAVRSRFTVPLVASYGVACWSRRTCTAAGLGLDSAGLERGALDTFSVPRSAR